MGAKTTNTTRKKNTGIREQNYNFSSGRVWPGYWSLPRWYVNSYRRPGSERVWSDWCSERSEAGQMLVVTNTREVGHKGPITFGEDTESLSGTCKALDHSPAPWAPAAPQALPPALCQAPPHKHQRGSQHELFAGAIYIQDRKTHWVAWGINNSLFAFSWSDSCDTPVREERTPNILVVSHLNSQSIMH